MEKEKTVKLSALDQNTTFLLPLVMMLVDYFAIVLAEEVAFLARFHTLFNVRQMHIGQVNYWITVPIVFIIIFQVEQLYKNRMQFWQLIPKIFNGCSYAMIGIIVLMYASKISENTSRLFIAFLWVFSFTFITVLRYFSKKVFEKMGLLQMPILIVGAGDIAESLARGIFNDAGMGYKAIGLVTDLVPKTDNLKRIPVLGTLEDIEKVIKETGVSTVMIALSTKKQEWINDYIYKVQRLVKNVVFVPNLVEMPMGNLSVRSLFEEKLMMLTVQNNLARPLNIVLKTVFDYVATFFGTIAISPILLLIALWIYKEDPGPIIFKHMRVGKDGKLFPCYKFRSMVTNSQEVLEHILATDPEAKKEWETNFKLKNDPRVTKIGAFMRRTSIDELPQLFNVLKGEMSLVGPRPVIQKEIDEYYKGYEDDYFAVKPGITGMWQVSGRSDTDYDERVELDRWYARNWSFWLDIMILYKTIAVVLFRKGAY